jgi:antitoxin VapB
MSEVKVAKLFRNGGSQAVRLPAEFRFEGDEVYVSRDEKTGDVTLSNKKETRKARQEFWAELFASLDAHAGSQDERVEFGKIMDEIVADRQNHPVSFTSRLVDDEGDA